MSDELYRLKVGLAEMLKGGVILDVTNADQARIVQTHKFHINSGNVLSSHCFACPGLPDLYPVVGLCRRAQQKKQQHGMAERCVQGFRHSKSTLHDGTLVKGWRIVPDLARRFNRTLQRACRRTKGSGIMPSDS